jgi:hypothetical protein
VACDAAELAGKVEPARFGLAPERRLKKADRHLCYEE